MKRWRITKTTSSLQTNIEKILFLCMMACLATNLHAHKYYVSTVMCSVEGDTMYVKMSLFFDDMESAIYETTGYFLHLCSGMKNKKHEADSLVLSYVKERFFLTDAASSSVPLGYEGYTCGDETMEVSMYFVLSSRREEHYVMTDKVLMDVYPEQRNIIQFSHGGKKHSVLLSKGRESTALDIQR